MNLAFTPTFLFREIIIFTYFPNLGIKRYKREQGVGSQLFCKDIVMIVLDSKLTLGRAGAHGSAGRGARGRAPQIAARPALSVGSEE